MKELIISIAAIILLVVEIPAYAKHEPFDDALLSDIAKRENVSVEYVKDALANGCSSGMVQPMNECANYLYAGQDIRLNRAYQLLMKKLKSKIYKKRMQNLQRKWIAYRDSSCKNDSTNEYWEGSADYHVYFTGCLSHETVLRAEQLNEYLNCTNSCPWQ
jgi:uncharacterized protein YecT (DUF1311 family)